VYSATFIFIKKQFDDAFHALDQQIADFARTTPGYLGEESWDNPANGQIANTYYWADRSGLDALMHHPAHLKAKTEQAKWLNGYQVIISQVLGAYGDNAFPHPTQRIPASHTPAL